MQQLKYRLPALDYLLRPAEDLMLALQHPIRQAEDQLLALQHRIQQTEGCLLASLEHLMPQAKDS